MSSSRPRVSPYPLRSTRTSTQVSHDQSPIQTGGAREWEDVRCVICMEPPHNAVILHCSSSSNGCRAYMCDTSFRHSNCFKKYRKRNNNLLTKSLNCPLCRGEVYETTIVKSARRFMNAKKRNCLKNNCEFSGTYSQLNNHLKAEHPGPNEPVVAEAMNGARNPHENEAVHPQLPMHIVVHVSNDGIMRDIDGLSQLRNTIGSTSALDYVASLMPTLGIQAITMLRGWTH